MNAEPIPRFAAQGDRLICDLNRLPLAATAAAGIRQAPQIEALAPHFHVTAGVLVVELAGVGHRLSR